MRNPDLAAAQVGEIATGQLRPNVVVRARLQELSAAIGETVGLTILHQKKVLVIDRVESSLPLRMQYGIGTLLPVHCTASGKVLLAFNDHGPDIVDTLNLEPRTPNTITDCETLRLELNQVRQH